MSTMAYPSYDSFGRSISRRQSLPYGSAPMSYGSAPMTPYGMPMNYSYDQGMYGDPMMYGEAYPQPSYQIYGPPAGSIPMSRRLTGAYDDMSTQDGYFPDVDRPMTPGPLAPIIHPNSLGMPRRQRRHSTVSFDTRPPPMDVYRRPSSIHITFKRKGSFVPGVGLTEAQANVRLSNNELYTIYDFHTDGSESIFLKVKWAGYSSLTYEIPLDNYDGRVSLQTLARRVSRACVHYLQANVIPIPWDRVELHHLEEISYGTWQPMLTTR